MPTKPTTAQLIATLNVSIAQVQAADAYRRDGVVAAGREQTRKAINHYTPSKLDDAEGQGRR